MKSIKLLLVVAAVSVLSACGSMSSKQIAKDAELTRARIKAERDVQASTPPKPLVEHLQGAYLGNSTVPLAYASKLPAVFREQITLNFPARAGSNGRVSLATVTARITHVTGIPVRIRPDVFVSAHSLMRKGDGNNTSPLPTATSTNNAPMPMPIGNNIGNTPISTQAIGDFDTNLPMEHVGSLAQYLDFICARLGINWEYRDGGINLYRFVTKTLAIKVSPGDLKFTSSLSKGSSNGVTSGGTGTTESAGAGTFTSETSSSVSANASIWKTLEKAIDGMKTPLGKVTIDEAAAFVIITDTKNVVDTVTNYVNEVNTAMTRQIDIEIRTITVSTTDSVAAGFNIDAIYSKIANGIPGNQYSSMSPGSLVESNAGQIGFSVLSPTSRWSGSKIVAQALNELGTIISDETKNAITTNRVPVPIASFTTEGYLASTTPGTSALGGSAGLPGLTPGQLTTGSFLNVLPTAFENGSVLLRLAFDDTVSKGMGVISNGDGVTFQQIQTPKFTGSKSDHHVGLRDGESLVLMATTADKTNATNRIGLTGLSEIGSRSRESKIIIVTPRVRAGI